MTAAVKHRPDPTEYAPYYTSYIGLVPEDDILAALEMQLEETLVLLHGIPEEQALARHPPYTWSIKEVVGHVTDTERVFGYRALRFAREDPTPLSGFDENPYVRSAGFDTYPLTGLLAGFEAVRRSHLILFRYLDERAWKRGGEENGSFVSVRALAYIIVGHTRHHLVILRKRLS
jgi:hypothetical protein